MTFTSEKAGQLWYRLELAADAAPPVDVPPMRVSVGSSATCIVTLDNPTRHASVVAASIDNERNFSVEPAGLELAPLSSQDVRVTYDPTSVGQQETGLLIFDSDRLGKWEFRLSGQGEAPESEVREVHLRAVAGLSSSTVVPFLNPFDENVRVEVSIQTDEDESETQGTGGKRLPRIGNAPRASGAATGGGGQGGALSYSESVFQLLRPPVLKLGPRGSVQLPIGFSPQRIRKYEG